jgi:cytochrome c oxidase subunit 4
MTTTTHELGRGHGAPDHPGDEDGDGHGAAAGANRDEHPEHVTPVLTYVKVYGALLVLTGVTVQVSIMDLGQLSVAVAMAVAVVKASLVAAIFMHLKWAERFNVMVFVTSLLFVALFFGLTMVDLQTRGALNPEADTLIYQRDQDNAAREQEALSRQPPPAPAPAPAGAAPAAPAPGAP